MIIEQLDFFFFFFIGSYWVFGESQSSFSFAVGSQKKLQKLRDRMFQVY